MLSRNLYKPKKSPLNAKRKKTILSVVLVLALFSVAYGVYSFAGIAKPKKEELKIETGDRPLKQNIVIYINADKGLSLRKERDPKAERLAVIPNKTKLEATEELDGWYKVSYEGKEGWIAKEYTTLDAPAEDLSKDWSVYKSPSGYSIKYPVGWKYQDYGADANVKTVSLTGFGNSDLPPTLPQGGEFVAPIIIKVSGMTLEEVKKQYSSISGVVTEATTFGNLAATKYTYTAASTGTQVTSIVVDSGGKVFVFSESGGYLDDLLNMGKTFTIGA
jgi:hypothetical protein